MNIEMLAEMQKSLRQGALAFERPEPLRLSQWAADNFYLSAESSYIEGTWEAFPFQVGIMDVISNDDIREVWFKKSARLGYTKIILAAMAYFAEHKKRNQAVWQPVDDDADEFVKTELDPMIRDVPALQAIFPYYDKKSKYNTLRQKSFTGSMLHIRGGTSAKNYRRISVDVGYLDELDAFDSDVDKEGSPVKLSGKRLEGATFPKHIGGSTPKTKHSSLIEAREDGAQCRLRYEVPCPHCDQHQQLEWGGKDVPHGMKWSDDDPTTAAYLCRHCSALFTQDQYLEVCGRGVWRDQDTGVWLDPDALFRHANGEIADTPLSVGMTAWTALSPMTSWTQIVREFLSAKSDQSELKTFVNTTLGETWEEDESQRLEQDSLYARREHYRAEVPSDEISVITFGVDTQDDRFEIQWDGWGSGEQRWSLDYRRLYGDPSRPGIWKKLAELLRRKFVRPDGTILQPLIGTQDHGGHYSDEVNKFSRKLGIRFLIPVKGSSVYGKPVAVFPRKPNRNRVYLTEVGTDTAKDLLMQRLGILEPGPGYWHFPVSDAFDETYFKQLTAEERVPRWAQGRKRFVWIDKGRPHESWDCSVYSLAAIRIAQQFMGVNLETLASRQLGQTVGDGKNQGGSSRKKPWINTDGSWI